MKKTLLILLAICSFSSFVFSQNQKFNEPGAKAYFDANKDLGGDVIVKNTFLTFDNGVVTRTFEIESPTSGDFYLVAWLSTVKLPNGDLMNYNVSINNQIITKILPKKNDWHCAALGNKMTVSLLQGINTISFSCPAPESPRIEFVKLVKDITKATISSEKYDAY